MIFFSKGFAREVKRLSKKNKHLKQDVLNLAKQIENKEKTGTPISDFSNNAVIKIRLQNESNNQGKSAGYRVIYLVQKTEGYYFLAIYSKSEISSLTPGKIKDLIKSM